MRRDKILWSTVLIVSSLRVLYNFSIKQMANNGENKMSQIDEKIRRRYNRAARFYDLLEKPMEIMVLKKWRMEVMKDLEGKVLEVGVGTGKNIEYYVWHVYRSVQVQARLWWKCQE